MTNSFGDSETELIYKGQRSKKLPPIIHNVARRKLRMNLEEEEKNHAQEFETIKLYAYA